jgi:hypothetical protein
MPLQQQSLDEKMDCFRSWLKPVTENCSLESRLKLNGTILVLKAHMYRMLHSVRVRVLGVGGVYKVEDNGPIYGNRYSIPTALVIWLCCTECLVCDVPFISAKSVETCPE